jgi:hypothetical protein
MKKSAILAAGLILGLCLAAGSTVMADTTTLQSVQVTITGPGGPAGNVLNDLDSPSGSGSGYTYSSSGFDSGAGFGSSTYGSYTITLTAASTGNYYVSGFFDTQLNLDFYNEYAAIHGSALAGQTWEVGDPNTSGLNPFGANDALNNTLTNSNGIPGTNDNSLKTCTSSCNGDVAYAMGFNESLTAGEVETVTFTVSATNPGGFNIEQVHPVDGLNPTAQFAYFSGSSSVQMPCTGPNCGGTGVPEPSSLMLLGTSLCGLLGLRKKLWN